MNKGVDRIWLDSYPEGVPAQIDADRYASLAELFEDSVARFGERPAFANMGKTLSFDQLDALSRDHPIYVSHITGHAGATNSLGLAYRGIDDESKDPRGGRFGRDPDTGRLDGLLDGMTAMGELGVRNFRSQPTASRRRSR